MTWPTGGPGGPGDGNSWGRDPASTTGRHDSAAAPSYSGLGVYGQQGEPSGPDRRRKVLIGALTAVIVVCVTATVVLLVGGGEEETAGGDDTPAPAPTSETSATAETAAAQEGQDGPAPLIPDWLPVASAERNAVYDVPPGWEEREQLGFTLENGDEIWYSAPASYQWDFCSALDYSARGTSGIWEVAEPDQGAAARQLAEDIARSAYGYFDQETGETISEFEYSEPTPVTVGGNTQGSHVRAEVLLGQTHDCLPATGVVHVVTIPSTAGGSLAIVATGDQSAAHGVADSDLRQIVESLRPLN
ncbi:hypothetical protein [Actinoalloteichus sp. AHMU CJ021]|uniref:hypothetical protein n=1 Tax=Actinoalloteichus sp. AHMU CJ021 TaxID=2072503 RepID=UPI00307B2C8E